MSGIPEACDYLPGFLDRTEADCYLALLESELAWSQSEIMLFGKPRLQPRLIAWYGDPVARYRYSGLSLDPLDWHPALLELRDRLERETGRRFNSVLANAYRDGRDSMGWHRDDEPELGEAPYIASVSLGAERRFSIREDGQRARSIILHHGSLLLMHPEFQRQFRHALPKTRQPVGLRINLTYRLIRSQAPVLR